jgi:hypothetical protein
MAEDKFNSNEINFRQWLPWTMVFKGFWLALDHKKLILAAGGILAMAMGWWLLAVTFINFPRTEKPVWPYPSADYPGENEKQREQAAWNAFKVDRAKWNLRYEAAGPGPGSIVGKTDNGYWDAGDVANSPEEFTRIVSDPEKHTYQLDGVEHPFPVKAYGQLRTWPWFEDRGPNPMLLLTGKAGATDEAGTAHAVPWQRGGFFDWLFRVQVPVLIEPLVKFLRPVGYFLHPSAGALNHFYFLLVIAWTVSVWAIVGGAITRIAAVQLARDERVGIADAVRFTLSRWRSYFFASFAPLLGIAAIVIALCIFGIFNWIPFFAEFWDGLLWFIPLTLGLLIAFVLVGLIGWPMIHATLSTEGSDSFDALSRSYSYVYQKPWHYLWYAVVALTYGAIVVFFVGLMGSLMVYLGKWGVGLTPGTNYFNRDPSYLFVFAPTSFGWRELLLQGSPIADPSSPGFTGRNYIGAGLVAVWLYLVFLMVIGFGYSYFWSASTIIYLLMRRKVDDTDLDEVYLDEDDSEDAYTPSLTPAPAAPPSPVGAGSAQLQMVESPTLRTSPASTEAGTSRPAGSSEPGDGDGAKDAGATP